jgi:hypothetical protein
VIKQLGKYISLGSRIPQSLKKADMDCIFSRDYIICISQIHSITESFLTACLVGIVDNGPLFGKWCSTVAIY